MEIKVLGPGCSRCQQTEKVVKEAVAEAGVEAQIEKVSDVMKIAGYGVFGTPAVVIDGEVRQSCITAVREGMMVVTRVPGSEPPRRCAHGWTGHAVGGVGTPCT